MLSKLLHKVLTFSWLENINASTAFLSFSTSYSENTNKTLAMATYSQIKNNRNPSDKAN